VRPDFKETMADLASFLSDLRLWLDQVELEIRSSPSADRFELERKVLDDLAGPVGRSLDAFIEKFEGIAEEVEPEMQAAHRTYLRRQLHPLVLCSPFAYRTFQKPLGYAGDYEVVDMMLRPPYEGASLFAKTLNLWLLAQAPATAHRNRVKYLCRKLLEETSRTRLLGRRMRVYTLGCGPAAEVCDFLKQEPSSDHTDFTLLDFNEETLVHLRKKLERIKQENGRSTRLQFMKKSVHHLLKDAGRSIARPAENQYDLVYCAGLFDYLADNVCRRLTEIFYELLAPGGLAVVTNVSDAMNSSRPFRNSMEYILDWHLIYRNGAQIETLTPSQVPEGCSRVLSEQSGVNIFLEIRKPNNA
jgi:extracellular factor (EF) 3-hydroxypalmitic acid methyl ester biosynthesis protein